jgi:hypothetical protein
MTAEMDRASWLVGTIVLFCAACVDDANVVGSGVGDAGADGSHAGTPSTGSGGRTDAASAGAASTTTQASGGRTSPTGGVGGSEAQPGGMGASSSGEGGSEASTGGSKTGGSSATGGAHTGGRDTGGTGGANTGGNGGAAGGSGGTAGASTGGAASGGTAGAAGSGTYEPCAGKACGDACAPCDPEDSTCGPILMTMTCDANGNCVQTGNPDCPTLWAETNASQYALDESGTTTLHNDTNETVYLPGCADYDYEQKVGEQWTDRGPNAICTWEGYVRPVPAGTDVASGIGPFTLLGAGTWRLRFTVGHGCLEDQPLSTAECTSVEDVFTPAFLVPPDEPCADPDLLVAYAACTAAADADTCALHGGTWAPFGAGSDPICQCETGDGGCPCTDDADCVTVCLAPVEPNSSTPCRNWTQGTCAAHPIAGCWCVVDAGQSQEVCWD